MEDEKILYSNGLMGVPITFFDKYLPENWDIIDMIRPKLNDKIKYARIIIKRKPIDFLCCEIDNELTDLVRNHVEIVDADNNPISEFDTNELDDAFRYLLMLKDFLIKKPNESVNGFLLKAIHIPTNKASAIFLDFYKEYCVMENTMKGE